MFERECENFNQITFSCFISIKSLSHVDTRVSLTHTPSLNVGTLGDCPTKLKDGEHCLMTCDRPLTLTGITQCDHNKLVMPTCFNEETHICTDLCPKSHDGFCDDEDTCTYGSDCGDCGPRSRDELVCQVEPPLYGRMGTCPPTLKHRESCIPECDPGYTLFGEHTCDHIHLRPARCYKPALETCDDSCLESANVDYGT